MWLLMDDPRHFGRSRPEQNPCQYSIQEYPPLPVSWQIEVTEQFERDAKRYAKKHPSEYQAVMENIARS